VSTQPTPNPEERSVSDIHDFNARVIAGFRANGGAVGGDFAGATILLLTTTGATPGLEQVSPTVCRVEGDDAYVVASKAGAPTNPDCYHNPVANPEVTVEFGTDSYAVRAAVIEGAERDRIYQARAEQYPGCAEYETLVGGARVIPVVRLDRIRPDPPGRAIAPRHGRPIYRRPHDGSCRDRAVRLVPASDRPAPGSGAAAPVLQRVAPAARLRGTEAGRRAPCACRPEPGVDG